MPTDKQLMDWLESHHATVLNLGGVRTGDVVVLTEHKRGSGRSIREATRAAMSEGPNVRRCRCRPGHCPEDELKSKPKEGR